MGWVDFVSSSLILRFDRVNVAMCPADFANLCAQHRGIEDTNREIEKAHSQKPTPNRKVTTDNRKLRVGIAQLVAEQCRMRVLDER